MYRFWLSKAFASLGSESRSYQGNEEAKAVERVMLGDNYQARAFAKTVLRHLL